MSRTPRELGRVMTLSVGNTTISSFYWSQEGQPLLGVFDTWPMEVGFCHREWDICVLSGVVPQRITKIEKILKQRRFAGRHCLRFRREIPCPLDIAPRSKSSVGDDRLAAAVGALTLDSSRPWVVIDAGTALTVNAVCPQKGKYLGRFEGGLIMPGEELCLSALRSGTAQLPHLDHWPLVAAPNIGRSTSEAIRAGVRKMQAAAAYEVALAQAKLLGKNTGFVLTGGGAENIWIEYERQWDDLRARFDSTLVHRGLYEAWRRAAVAGR